MQFPSVQTRPQHLSNVISIRANSTAIPIKCDFHPCKPDRNAYQMQFPSVQTRPQRQSNAISIRANSTATPIKCNFHPCKPDRNPNQMQLPSAQTRPQRLSNAIVRPFNWGLRAGYNSLTGHYLLRVGALVGYYLFLNGGGIFSGGVRNCVTFCRYKPLIGIANLASCSSPPPEILPHVVASLLLFLNLYTFPKSFKIN